jgi:MutS-like protein
MLSEEAHRVGEADRLQSLHRTIHRLDRFLARAKQASDGYTRWRLAIFLCGAAVTVTLFHQAWYHAGNTSLACFLLLFLAVARYHTRLENKTHRLKAWRAIKAAHVARLTLQWTGLPRSDMPVVENHPYAADLDLIGPHSLFHLLNTCRSSNGRERLSDWILHQPPAPEAWSARRALVQELAGLPLFRDRLALEAALVGESELDGLRVRAALESPAGFPGLRPILVIETALAAATPILLLASDLTGLPEYWALTLTAYAALYLLTTSKTGPVFTRALSLHDELNKLGAVFRFLERRSYRLTPRLERLCAPLFGHRHSPSRYIRRLARVAHALSIRAHPLVHVALNLLMPWDLFFTYRLDRLRHRVLAHVPRWLDMLAEIEAAASLATFAYLHPAYAWPEPASASRAQDDPERSAAFTGTALGHPLIPSPHRVTNDLELRERGQILLVTGSNMSGKSTFLRTIGINTCLAQAGAPVCAAAFEWSWVRVECCIRVDDSLEAGLSFFYAEVKRLKRLLDAAQEFAAPPVLFLIDEIFKGTNNRERLIGSRAFIQALAISNGFGLVTTHDLELAEMDRSIPRLTNAHFQETVHGAELRFDYKLRPGPCPTTNALRIMALEGLPVPPPGKSL